MNKTLVLTKKFSNNNNFNVYLLNLIDKKKNKFQNNLFFKQNIWQNFFSHILNKNNKIFFFFNFKINF